MCPEPCAGQGSHLHLILRQLRLGDTLGGPHDDPPLYGTMEMGDRAEQLWVESGVLARKGSTGERRGVVVGAVAGALKVCAHLKR